MYESFWGLKEQPFGTTPDPAFFYLSPQHEEALARVKYAILSRKGLAMLTGAVGTGKTTLTRALLTQMKNIKSAVLLNPKNTPTQLLKEAAYEFGFEIVPRFKREVVVLLRKFALQKLEEGIFLVIILDEAQLVSRESLEEIRLLTNWETNKEKLFTVVLVGQPELEKRLRKIPQLNQRVVIRAQLGPLNDKETLEYIVHRMRVAGAPLFPFQPDAVKEIYNYSAGIPRLINMICDMCLLEGYIRRTKTLTNQIVQDVVKDLGGVLEDAKV
ncbi:MAG: AAA family ATPase [Caldiserica bacterium]|jgi:general secretion pathway protein A|nr:AAA family ATPase [Caldisericota bacterium]MDH7562861.1 AAA family ATPase [Caldisericota bacterium]